MYITYGSIHGYAVFVILWLALLISLLILFSISLRVPLFFEQAISFKNNVSTTWPTIPAHFLLWVDLRCSLSHSLLISDI